MKKILLSIIVLSFGLLVGCNSNNSKEAQCGDIIKLHDNGEEVFVNKQEIMLLEKHGDKAFISFNHELEKVNGSSRGNGITFDESLEEVNKIINCEN